MMPLMEDVLDPDRPAGLVIVPNTLSDAINRMIDAALAECPGAACEREMIYSQMIAYFSQFGSLPASIKIEPRSPREAEAE